MLTAAYDQRECRNTGRSRWAVLMVSLERHPIRKATKEQIALALLIVGDVMVSWRDESFKLKENRYSRRKLLNIRVKIVIRFDPDNSKSEIFYYRRSCECIGLRNSFSQCVLPMVEAARAYMRRKRQNRKALKQILENEKRTETADLVALMPSEPVTPGPPKIKGGATLLAYGLVANAIW